MLVSRENYRYTESGLPYVVLNGVEVRRCPSCGAEEVAIPRIEDLHRAIALDVSGKPERLTPEEVRFLRKYLGWSGATFARKLGVTPETVSRWENGAQEMGNPAETVLRVWVGMFAPDRDYVRKILERAGTNEAPRKRHLLATPEAEKWTLSEQAA